VRRWAALLALLLVAACGVPPEDAPRALRSRDPVPGTSPIGDPSGRGRVGLYFVRNGQVVLATRPVRRSTPTPELVRLLFAGTAPEERAAGLISVIPATLEVEDVDVQGRTAVVTLSGPDTEVQRTQPLAYAQIVATLTPNRVAGVRFRLRGADLPVPRADGSLTDAPLDRDDYAPLLAVPATAGPTPSA
jgi:hypothetical protein